MNHFPQKKNIVAYYLFRGNADDSSRNENHGVVEGAALTENRFGNHDSAYRFNGENDHILVKNNNSLDLRRSFSICTWIKPLSIQRRSPGIVCKGRSSVGTGFRLGMQGENENMVDLCLNNGNTRAKSYNAGLLSKSSSIDVNKWVHICGTWDLDKMKIYVNGELENENVGVATSPLSYSQEPLNIGRETSGLIDRYFHGDIDEVLIYNISLDSEDIKTIFSSEKPPPHCPKMKEEDEEEFDLKKVSDLGTDLIAYYPFNGDANDETKNKNHGIINEAELTEDRNGTPNSAFRFNGVSSFIEMKYHPVLDLRDKMSVCAWIKPSVIQKRPPGIVCKGRSPKGTGFRLGVQGTDNNLADFCLNDGRSYNAASVAKNVSVEVDKWVHICGTWDVQTSDIKIYVDGEVRCISNGVAKTRLSYSEESLNIGRETSGLIHRYFQGDIDEVMVFGNRVLDDKEVYRIFRMNNHGFRRTEKEMDENERIAFVLGDEINELATNWEKQNLFTINSWSFKIKDIHKFLLL